MTNELEPIPESPMIELGTLHANTPDELVVGATRVATSLAAVIRKTKLSVNIQGRDYVKVEGWTTLCAMLGVVAREIDTVDVGDGSFVSTIELVRMNDGVVVSRASAQCGGEDDGAWTTRKAFARRSMAQTRATGKACRLAFSWVMTLAGYAPTPAEEMMDATQDHRPPIQEPRRKAAPAAPAAPQTAGGTLLITAGQVKLIYAKLNNAGLTHPEFCKEFGIEHVAELPRDMVNGALEWIQKMTPSSA